MVTPTPASIRLSRKITIQKYRELKATKNKIALAAFLKDRFTERYLAPLQGDTANKSGFTIMAISCLMIETLESFHRGWPRTNGNSEKAFRCFFSRWPAFEVFRPLASDFYKHIRCGILHQSETTGGWRIWRNGALCNPVAKTINATLFLKEIEIVLNTYVEQLQVACWKSPVWICFRKKMDSICQNAVLPK